MKTKIIISILGIFLFLGACAIAGTIISNNPSSYLVSDNITINNSGMFYSNNKVSSRTADVVVCRGTSVLDDLIKSFQCDVVCKSTDSAETCGLKLNSSIATLSTSGGGFIDIGCGNFPNGIYIVPRSNIHIQGHGVCTLLNLTGTDEYFLSTGNINNFELSNVKFIQSYVGNGVGFDINEVPSSNIYLHDIDFGNINYDCFRVSTNQEVSTTGSNRHNGVIVQRVRTNYCRNVIGKADHVKILDSYFNESGSGVNTIMDVGFYENNASVTDALVQGNTYISNNNNFCLGSSYFSRGFRILDNYFYSNDSAIMFAIESNFGWYADVVISGNTFHAGKTGGTAEHSLVYIAGRSFDSSFLISNNMFFGNSSYGNNIVSKYFGVYSNSPAIITSNDFVDMGSSCIQGNRGMTITNNRFYDCAYNEALNGWIYLGSDNPDIDARTLVQGNHFYSGRDISMRVIRIEGLTNSSIYNNDFSILNKSNVYYFDGGIGGIEYNSTFIDDYSYSFIPSSLCSLDSHPVAYGRTIHNSTAQCTCIGGAWKCLTYT